MARFARKGGSVVAKYGFLIPVYNHGRTAGPLALDLAGRYGMPVILVNDGSSDDSLALLREASRQSNLLVLVDRLKNGGKGAAVRSGFEKAHELGLDYVLQIDADGQHDASRIPRFLELSKENPGALICGYPIFDASVPQSRLKGRQVSNTWVHILTLDGKSVKDAMCGFRVYPVEACRNLTRKGFWSLRMGFDMEILVRLAWKGVPIISEGVGVTYPSGGSSNFHMVKDNIKISLMFTRLCIGFVFRLPLLLGRRK